MGTPPRDGQLPAQGPQCCPLGQGGRGLPALPCPRLMPVPGWKRHAKFPVNPFVPVPASRGGGGVGGRSSDPGSGGGALGVPGAAPLAALRCSVRPPRCLPRASPRLRALLLAQMPLFWQNLQRGVAEVGWVVFVMGYGGLSTPFPGGEEEAGVLPGLPAAGLDPGINPLPAPPVRNWIFGQTTGCTCSARAVQMPVTQPCTSLFF